MIAIGGTFGTSVFLSTEASVASAGPLGGLISYLIVVGHEFIGSRNWHIESAPIVGETATDKTVNISTTCILAFFSFGGTELVGITAGEPSNTGKAIPKAIRHTFWRIMVIPWTDESLLGTALTEVNQAAPMAPFTTIFKMANLPGADHAVNAIFLSSVLLAGQSAYYASTRTLMAMEREGNMPKIFGRVNSRGVPLYSLTLVTLVACIAFVADVVAFMIAFLEGYQAVTVDPFVVEDVIAVFAGAPVFFFSILGRRIYHKIMIVPLLEVDLDSGRHTIVQGISADGQQARDEDEVKKEKLAQLLKWKRAGLKVLSFTA
ncbi:hypothetical protein FBU30_006570 [Linnemannia zychae]|nr:hypothetical protein FBU30_006570 [Linnemannia zychae]